MKSNIIKSMLFALLFYCFNIDTNAQKNPSDNNENEVEVSNIALDKTVSQSSTHSFSIYNDANVSRTVDGITSGEQAAISRTMEEENPWWSIDLEASSFLSSLKIYYPEEVYEEGFSNYYVLMSEFPFINNDLNTNLSSSYVEHIYVSTSLPSGFEIPLGENQARYVRVQLDGIGDITVFEFAVIGGNGVGFPDEICGNDVDDDFDGDIDCEDSDCVPVIANVEVIDPTCPSCNDGEIRIQAFGHNLTYSIDGGQDFVGFPGPTQIRTFENLDEGIYNVVVTNGTCSTEYDIPIVLSAPLGTLTGHCPNGGFEEGTLNGWIITGSSTILQTNNFVDLFVPQVDGNYPVLNTYMLMLGDGLDGSNTDIAEYCFIVDQDNSDFHFTYAIVMEDPNHPITEIPFFRYQIFVNGDEDNPICSETIDSGDPFLVNGEGIYKYKSWTCVSCDLNEFEGQNICVKFTVRDCTQGLHEGHAYIDGLCSDVEDFVPVIDIVGNDVYCEQQPIDLNVSGSGYNTFQWTISKINSNGNYYDIYEFPSQIGYDASFNDILQAYGNSSNYSIDCVDYIASLHVTNECGEANTSSSFSISCDQHSVGYCENIILCQNVADVAIIGEVDCVGCIFDWTPANYFYDSSLAFPTIKGDYYTDALSREYEVEVTTPENCVYNRSVNVFENKGYNFSFDHTEDRCSHTFIFTFDFTFDVNPNTIQVMLYDSNNEMYNTPVLLTNESDNNTLVFYVNFDNDRLNILDLEFEINTDYSSLSNVCQIGSNAQCAQTFQLGNYRNSIFPKPWKIFLTNSFYPGSDNEENKTFHPFFATPLDGTACTDFTNNSSIYYMKIDIFDKWGGHLFSDEVESPFNSFDGLVGNEIYWDGFLRCGFAGNSCTPGCTTGDICKDNGVPIVHQSGVYVFMLTIKSCTNLAPQCINDSDPCNVDVGEYCSSNGDNSVLIITRDVTLL